MTTNVFQVPVRLELTVKLCNTSLKTMTMTTFRTNLQFM